MHSVYFSQLFLLSLLLVLLGLALERFDDLFIGIVTRADGLDLALDHLAVLVDSGVVDSIDPSLVKEDDEYDVVSEARESGCVSAS